MNHNVLHAHVRCLHMNLQQCNLYIMAPRHSRTKMLQETDYMYIWSTLLRETKLSMALIIGVIK